MALSNRDEAPEEIGTSGSGVVGDPEPSDEARSKDNEGKSYEQLREDDDNHYGQ